ncbi:TolC family protein [Leptospira ilyithenensis]|nr:TolC family protein [Leptospira ilyithenensis]
MKRKIRFLLSIIIIHPAYIYAQQSALSGNERNSSETITLSSIEEATTLGLKQNLNLIASKFDIEISRAEVLSAGSRKNPSLNALSSLNPFRKNYDQTTSAGPKQLDLLFTVPLDISQKIKSRKDLAYANLKISEILFHEQIRDVSMQIQIVCIDLILHDALRKLLKEKESNLTGMVRMIENRIGGSNIQPLLLSRSKLAVNNASIELRLVKLQRDMIARKLITLLGIYDQKEIILNFPLREIHPYDLPDYEFLMASSKDSLPGFIALKLGSEYSEKAVELAKAEVWDDFDFSFGLSRQYAQNANPSDTGSSKLPGESSFAFGFNIPLPVLYRNEGEIKKAEILKLQNLKRLNAFELELGKEIQKLHSNILLYKKFMIEIEKEQLPRAQQVLNSQKRLFGTGGSNLLEYFDSISAYNETLVNYYNIVSEYRKNFIQLLSITGFHGGK